MDSGLNRKNPVPLKVVLPRSPIRRLVAKDADAPIVLDETRAKPWGKLRLLTLFDARKACSEGP
jgi:hypothetical protein